MGAASDTGTPRPSGREQVTRALLSATEELCTRNQPSTFTVSDIAHEADVTTSLLYFYFDSKDDMIIETLRSIASDLDAEAAGASTESEMAAFASRAIVERPAFARIIAWLILEGRSVTQEMGEDPFLRRLMATLAKGTTDDPSTQAGAIACVLLSKSFFGHAVSVAVGREGDDERIPEELDRYIATALEPQS